MGRNFPERLFCILCRLLGTTTLFFAFGVGLGRVCLANDGRPHLAGHPSAKSSGVASWYDASCCVSNRDPRCPTASGASLYQLIRDGVPYAAMWDVPLHSQVEVCGRLGCQRVDILDRGPARKLNRLIDLNPDTFEAICGDLAHGVCQVEVSEVRP